MLSEILRRINSIALLKRSKLFYKLHSYGQSTIACSPTRSWLVTKKSKELIKRAQRSKPDVLILDMEDSVPKSSKAEMRETYLSVLNNNVVKRQLTTIRVNALTDLDEALEDIKWFTVPQVDAFMLPKVESKSMIEMYEQLVTEQEIARNMEQGTIKFVPIIESVDGLLHAEEIGKASERNVALATGNQDFRADTRCENDSALSYALITQVVLAARSAGIKPIVGGFDMIGAHSEAEAFYKAMRDCGYDGAVAVTIDQAIQANNIFSPSPRELHWSKQATITEGITTYRMTPKHNTQMFGPPHQSLASKIIKESEEIEKISASVAPKSKMLYSKTTQRGLQNQIQIGEEIRIPFELKLSEAWRTLWESSFINQIPCSNRLASNVDPPSIPLPFALVNLLCVAPSINSLSHSAKFHLGCYNAVQHESLHADDTIQVSYRVEKAVKKSGKAGQSSTIVESKHHLFNQKDNLVFSVKKRTMFPPLDVIEPKKSSEIDETNPPLFSSFVNLPASLVSSKMAVPSLQKGDFFIHDFYKNFNQCEVISLCTLFRIPNSNHHNALLFSSAELVVPGPFVAAATISNSQIDIGEMVYEEWPSCSSINSVNLNDVIATMTYVVSVERIADNENLEEVILRHIGVKNVDLGWLAASGVPEGLVNNDFLKPRNYENFCAEECPQLFHKIAVDVVRKIIRVNPVNRVDLNIDRTC